MKQTVVTATFVLAAAGASSAQQPLLVQAPPSPPAPSVAPVPAAAPFIAVPFDPKSFSALTELKNLKDFKWEAQPTVVQAGAYNRGATQLDASYSQAKSFIDRDMYERALEPLERVITAKGERADAATYWKAYSLWKLARRDEALSALSQLPKQFPDSRWLRDARALEVEVKQASGQAASTDAVDDDTKLLALSGIMRTDPDAALPAIEKMLAGTASVRLKERALFVLSQSRSDRARDIVVNLAKGNTNPDLQMVAIRYLAMSNSPDTIATLTTLYRADQSTDTRRTIISMLGSRGDNTAAITALIAIARTERNSEVRRQIVAHLSNSRTPEAKQYLLELIK